MLIEGVQSVQEVSVQPVYGQNSYGDEETGMNMGKKYFILEEYFITPFPHTSFFFSLLFSCLIFLFYDFILFITL